MQTDNQWGKGMQGVAYFWGKNLYGIGTGEMLTNVRGGGVPTCPTTTCKPLFTFSFVKNSINLIICLTKYNTLVR